MASAEPTAKAGWEVKTLGEVFETLTGNTPPKGNSELYGSFMPLVKPPELQDTPFDTASDGLSQEGVKAARTLPPNSILVSCIGNLGKIGLNTVPVAFNQQINAILPDNSKALPRFIFHQVLSNSFRDQLESLASGTTVPIVNKTKFNSVEITLPPLAEQERIVGILDEAFEGIAAATAQAEKNLHNARELFQSVLQSTFSQKGDDWEETTLGDEVEFLAGFAFKSSEYTDSEDGIRLLRGDNIIQGEFRWEGVKRWPKVKAAEYAKFELAQNDVVLAMDRPWVTAGLKVASIEENDLPCLQVQRTARLRVGTELHWTYLFHLIRSSSFVQYILGGQTGLGVPHISGKQILAFQFPKPPLPTQQAIVEKLDALSEETKRLEAIYERKKAALAELKQALLQKAFAGEL